MSIVRINSALVEGRVDIETVDATHDADIDRQIAEDCDAPPLVDERDLKRARLVTPLSFLKDPVEP